MRTLLRALIISLLTATNSAAQADAESSVAEVGAAFLDYVDAENGADVDRIAEHYFPGTFSSFGPRGGALERERPGCVERGIEELYCGGNSCRPRNQSLHQGFENSRLWKQCRRYRLLGWQHEAGCGTTTGSWPLALLFHLGEGRKRLEGSTSPHFVAGSSIARCRSASASSTAIAPTTRTAGHGTQPDPVCPSGVSSDGPGSPDRRFGDAGDRRGC